MRASAPRVPGATAGGATGLLLVALAVRGYVHFGLLTFIPLLEHDARHNSRAYGSRVLALMLFAGALGTLAAGPLADRYGRLRVLTLSFLAACPGVALYLADSGWLGLAGIAIAGAGVISTFGITIVVSQEYLPTPALDRGGPVHRPLDRPRRRRLVRDRRPGRLDRAGRRALDDPSGGAARDRCCAPCYRRPTRRRPRRRCDETVETARDDALEALAGEPLRSARRGRRHHRLRCGLARSRGRGCAWRWWSAATWRAPRRAPPPS